MFVFIAGFGCFLLHFIESPEEVDGGGAGGGEVLFLLFEFGFEGVAGEGFREVFGDYVVSYRGGNADRGGAADFEGLYCVEDFFGRGDCDGFEFPRKSGLIDNNEFVVLFVKRDGVRQFS